jgi:hypothetical protein
VDFFNTVTHWVNMVFFLIPITLIVGGGTLYCLARLHEVDKQKQYSIGAALFILCGGVAGAWWADSVNKLTGFFFSIAPLVLIGGVLAYGAAWLYFQLAISNIANNLDNAVDNINDIAQDARNRNNRP